VERVYINTGEAMAIIYVHSDRGESVVLIVVILTTVGLYTKRWGSWNENTKVFLIFEVQFGSNLEQHFGS